MKIEDRIIVALDVNNLGNAKKLIKTLWPRVKFFKIGLEMINTGQAPELIEYIRDLGGQVFYDIKLNDIPNTVGRAAKVISNLGVEMFTIHASAGRDSIRVAVKNKGRGKVVGVTILTSLAIRDTKDQVIKFSKMLKREGVYGVVCSSQESNVLKKLGLKIIIPGIRPSWAKQNEQKRTATPREALKNGADYIVIGRPITNPPKEIGGPREALARIIEEIES